MLSAKLNLIFFSVLVFAIFDSGFTSSLPSPLKPCSTKDQLTFNTCAKDAATALLPKLAKGIQELEIVPFEPLELEKVEENNAALKFVFSGTKVFGLTKSKIDDIKIDQNKKKITLTFTSTAHMEADYLLSGRLLVIPVTGDGASRVDVNDIQFVFKLYYDVAKGKDGKDHWIIKKHKVSYTPTKVMYRFQNLFNGNKQLGDAVHKFANENWLDVFQEVATPMMIKLTNTVAQNIKNFFVHVPVEEFLIQ